MPRNIYKKRRKRHMECKIPDYLIRALCPIDFVETLQKDWNSGYYNPTEKKVTDAGKRALAALGMAIAAVVIIGCAWSIFCFSVKTGVCLAIAALVYLVSKSFFENEAHEKVFDQLKKAGSQVIKIGKDAANTAINIVKTTAKNQYETK